MTQLDEVVDPDELIRCVVDGLVTVRAHQGLVILNYSASATWTSGAWDLDAVRRCRGLISEIGTDRVVARPWPKFFNFGQPEAPDIELHDIVEVTDKVDGSLGIVYENLSGQVCVATRGSLVSDQALHATEWIQRSLKRPLRGLDRYTLLCEIVYPENRIVLDYGKRDELVLLGGVVTQSGDCLSARAASLLTGWEFPVVEQFENMSLADALAMPPRLGAEGVVVRSGNKMMKIKQDDYVRLHRIVTGLSEKSVWEAYSEGVWLEDFLAEIPDEFMPWVRERWESLRSRSDETLRTVISLHEKILATLGPDFHRGDYAALAKRHDGLSGWLFMLLDGKDPYPSIVKTLRPSGLSRPREWETE